MTAFHLLQDLIQLLNILNFTLSPDLDLILSQVTYSFLSFHSSKNTEFPSPLYANFSYTSDLQSGVSLYKKLFLITNYQSDNLFIVKSNGISPFCITYIIDNHFSFILSPLCPSLSLNCRGLPPISLTTLALCPSLASLSIAKP